MRLHIVPDEKVINRCVDLFNEAFPNDNIFIVLTNNLDSKYVKKKNNVVFLKYDTKIFWKTIGSISNYEHIIIHFLTGDSVKFLNKINHPSIYWIAWGADIYNGMLEQRGYKLYAQENILWRISKKKLPYFIYKIAYNFEKRKRAKQLLSAAKKVTYFVPDSMYEEFPLLLSYYPELSHLQYKNFYYYPIDDILSKSLLLFRGKRWNIMIGNSASPTGNHLSVIAALKSFSLGNKKVIIPLSYGNCNYAKLITKVGSDSFGEKFHAVTDFLSLNEYNSLLSSVNVFIYGNWRQEAVGNILIALYLGGKVFLDKRNPLLKFYKSLGLVLFDIEELSDIHLSTMLSDEHVNTNRNILNNNYSKGLLIKLIKNNF